MLDLDEKDIYMNIRKEDLSEKVNGFYTCYLETGKDLMYFTLDETQLMENPFNSHYMTAVFKPDDGMVVLRYVSGNAFVEEPMTAEELSQIVQGVYDRSYMRPDRQLDDEDVEL